MEILPKTNVKKKQETLVTLFDPQHAKPHLHALNHRQTKQPQNRRSVERLFAFKTPNAAPRTCSPQANNNNDNMIIMII